MKILLIVGILAGAAGAEAADGPAWERGHYSQARLVPGGGAGTGRALAGIQIKLDDGWKTYWRNPGDSGLPPSFDWSGSANLKEARVLWPAPHRFTDASGTSIGYSGEVVFPVEVTPLRAGEPVDLALSLEYAICKDICVPGQAKLALHLAGAGAAAGGSGGLVNSFVARVPKERAAGAASLPRIDKANARLDGPDPAIVVEAEFPPGAAGTDLFAEGGEEVYLPPPQRSERIGEGRVRFTIKLPAETDLKALAGRRIGLTLVSDKGSSQTAWTVK